MGGHWSWRSGQADTIMDIERAFMVLDGLTPPPSWADLVGKINNQAPRYLAAGADDRRHRIFQGPDFQERQRHLWFKRDDLLEKVNQLLGEYYGAPIPEEQETEDDGGLFEPKTAVARNFGFFPDAGPRGRSVGQRRLPLSRQG